MDKPVRYALRMLSPNPPKGCDRRQLVLPVTSTIFAGRYGVIIRYGGTVDYRPTSQAIEAETYGTQDTGNGSREGWDERAFSVQVAEWAIAVGDETGASVAHPAGSLRRGGGMKSRNCLVANWNSVESLRDRPRGSSSLPSAKKDCRSIVVQLFCEPNVLPTFSTLPMKWAAASEGFLKVVERLGRPNPLTPHA